MFQIWATPEHMGRKDMSISMKPPDYGENKANPWGSVVRDHNFLRDCRGSFAMRALPRKRDGGLNLPGPVKNRHTQAHTKHAKHTSW